MKLRIFNYDYFNIFDNKYDPELECPIFLMTCRDKDGKFYEFKIPGNKGILRPHFFVPDNEFSRDLLENNLFIKHHGEKEKLEWEEWPHPAIYDENEKVLVVYTRYPFQVRWKRSAFERTYEADVPYPEMFIIQLGLNQGYIEVPDDKEWLDPEDITELPEEDHFFVEPRIAYWDIETEFIDDAKRFDRKNQLLISVVLYDNYENVYHTLEWDNKYEEGWVDIKDKVKRKFNHPKIPMYSREKVYHFTNEKDLLLKFIDIWDEMNPDGSFTFNGHGGNMLVTHKGETMRKWRNGFDEPVFHFRCLAHGLGREIQRLSPLPVMKNVYGKYYGVYSRGKGDKSEIVIRGLTPLDFLYAEPLMGYTRKYTDFFGRRNLDSYLKFFSNFHKIEHDGLTVAELKEIDLEKELLYNKIDVEGMVFLDKRFDFSRDIFDTVALSLVPGLNVLKATKIHDFLTRKYSKDYCVYDTKHQKHNRDIWKGFLKEKVNEMVLDKQQTIDVQGFKIKVKKGGRAGGFVTMKRGIQGWYAVIDFHSLYPYLAMAANAGIDTLIEVEEVHDDHYIDKKGKKWLKKDVITTPSGVYRKDKTSIEKLIWKDLLNTRADYKQKYYDIYDELGNPNHPEVKLYDSKQYNLKMRYINNKYGASGNMGYVAYSIAVYNTPPTMGQVCTRSIAEKFLPSIGYECRGGDTDSVFPALKSDNLEDAIKETEELVDKCNDYIDKLLKEKFNIDEHEVEIDWEKIGPNFYGHAMKNYALEVWAEDGRILDKKDRYNVYKGFELKKRDRSDVTEMVQKTYVDLALKSNNRAEFLDKMSGVCERIDKIFQYLPWSKISTRINLKKKLENYSDNYYSKRAAQFSNENFGTNFGLNTNAFLGYLDLAGSHDLAPIMLFKEDDIPKIKSLGYDIDYQKHKEKYAIKKLDNLLENYDTNFNILIKRNKIGSPAAL